MKKGEINIKTLNTWSNFKIRSMNSNPNYSPNNFKIKLIKPLNF